MAIVMCQGYSVFFYFLGIFVSIFQERESPRVEVGLCAGISGTSLGAMGLMVRVAVNRQYIEFEASEPVTGKLLLRYQADASRLAFEHGLTSFLFDVRGFLSLMDPLDCIRAVEKLQGSDRRDSPRIAILTSADDQSHDFLETAAHNRGLPLRCFTKKSEALDWLLT